MLGRAAQRRLKLHTARSSSSRNQQLTSAFDQLTLPWLCPAQLRWIASSKSRPPPQAQSTVLDSIRGTDSPRLSPSRNASRTLATVQLTSRQDTPIYIPGASALSLGESQYQQISQQQSHQPSSSWNSADLLLFPNGSSRPLPILTKQNGIGGTSVELHQNLHASILVGRYDRAASIVRRLAQLFNPNTPQLIEAHNVYLRGLTDGLDQGKLQSTDAMKKIRYWYETQMRGQSVAANGNTFAIICRAALIGLPHDAQVRSIRRYLHFAEDAGCLEDTIASSELSDAEWTQLIDLRSEIFPEQFLKHFPEDAVTEASVQQFEPEVRPDLDQVRPVQQKGLGLAALKDSLYSIYNIDAIQQPYGASTPEDLQRLATERQIKLEEDVVDVAIARWRDEHEHMLKMGINTKLYSRTMEGNLWHWQQALEASIKEELSKVDQALHPDGQKDPERAEYGPYLEAVSPSKMAGITILTALHHCLQSGSEGVKLAILSRRLGSHIETEATKTGTSRNARSNKRKDKSELRKTLAKRLGHPTNAPAQVDIEVTSEDLLLSTMNTTSWPTHIQLQIGALLISKLIDTAKIPQLQRTASPSKIKNGQLVPAFRHCLDYEKGKKCGKVYPESILLEILKSEPPRSNVGLSGHMPMLVEPKAWESLDKGPYYRYNPKLMRHKDEDDVQVMYAKAAAEKGDLDEVFAGLNVLGKTPWRINQDVLKVMIDAWNTGDAIADLAPENPKRDLPPKPDQGAPETEMAKWRYEVKKIENELGGFHSQRCFTNLQLEVARAYVGKTFYYPHNIDFRGRAYPVPPFLNHMGADSARGLLTFGVAKPLGAEGLRWLRIHLSNLAGFDKASLEEREQYTMDRMDDVIDSATNPLDGKRWWLTAEDPWQCLAACFEMKAALDSPDPSQYMSSLPVAQDGSCNGLQHYAALGGDVFGASQVNLEPGSRPADVYSGVAKLVKEAIQMEADAGDEIAKLMVNKITRKVVKQTVMTNVYGVTFVGARAQVQRQLDAIMVDQSEISVPNYKLASYVAKHIFKALAHMFEGAHNIQYWLAECADRITRAITPEQIKLITSERAGKHTKTSMFKDAVWQYWVNQGMTRNKVEKIDFRTSVIWTTPLKLPVVQPYRVGRDQEVRTALQNIKFREPRAYDPVNRRRQIQAFPPNFVHSLDATHMLMSALKCQEEGLTFAAVHDSFWCHAADVGKMSDILRDRFIKMHKDDVIGRLAAEFKIRYKNSLHVATVYERSPLGQKILALRAATEKSKRDIAGRELKSKVLQRELFSEWDRQRLLSSSNPADRAKGQAMMTPGRLVSEASPEDYIVANPAWDSPDSKNTAADAELSELMSMEEDPDKDVLGEEAGHSVVTKIAKRLNKRSQERKVMVWAPLVFPEVPKRGDFDVERVRGSRYFFA